MHVDPAPIRIVIQMHWPIAVWAERSLRGVGIVSVDDMGRRLERVCPDGET
jgi:hypothetical protein